MHIQFCRGSSAGERRPYHLRTRPTAAASHGDSTRFAGYRRSGLATAESEFGPARFGRHRREASGPKQATLGVPVTGFQSIDMHQTNQFWDCLSTGVIDPDTQRL
jgi:hypothetical protein